MNASTTSLPWCSSGTNGIGGAGITLAMVESSSGAASASAMNSVTTSAVAASISIPPTTVSSSWRRNRNRVPTPKLPPPPRMAQQRSGWRSSSTRSSSPSAVTTSAAAGRGGVLDRGQPGLGPCRPALHVYIQRLHVPEVEHDPTVRDAVPGAAVAAASDGEFQPALACERHDARHVGLVGDPSDRRGPAVELAGEHLADVVVPGIVRGDHLAAQGGAELCDRGRGGFVGR